MNEMPTGPDYSQMTSEVAVAMQQGFSRLHELLGQAAIRHNNDMNFVSATTLLAHQLTSKLVGAKAAQNLEMEGIADAILQNRAAHSQPDKSA